VTCAEGEEAHIQHLAGIIDQKARAASEGTNLTETRLLLFSALFLADELAELRKRVDTKPEPPAASAFPDSAPQALAINRLAERIEKLASSLEELQSKS